MGLKDRPSVNLKAVQSATEPVDRLNLLGRWIGAKIEEIAQAEQRIDKRIEHLNATEQSLRTLFDALRKQVADTHPVLKELAQIRSQALGAVEQVVRATTSLKAQQTSTTSVVTTLPSKSPAEKPAAVTPAPPTSASPPISNSIDPTIAARLANQVAMHEQKIAQLCEAAQASLIDRASKIDADLDTNVQQVEHYLESRLLSAQQSADVVANRVSDQITVAQARANDIVRSADVYAQESIAKLRSEFDSLVEPIQERLATQVLEMETRLSTEMATIEETMKAQLNGFYLHLNQAGASLQNQLEEIAGDFASRAETSLAASRQTVRQQIDSLEDEVRLAVRPIIQLIEDRRINAERQSDAILLGMDEAMKIRLSELRRSGESTVQLVESQLIDKLKLIRPTAQAVIDSAQKQVGQRLQAALETVRSHVELSEQQLVDRIEDLRPRAAAALDAARTDINQHITSLETEANTATGWIEQRLSQRIDELTYRARKTVTEQIRGLDDASERLRRQGAPERIEETVGQPLEVDLHVENSNPQQRSNAA